MSDHQGRLPASLLQQQQLPASFFRSQILYISTLQIQFSELASQVFLQRSCSHCTVRYSCYNLSEVLDTDITSCVNAVNICFLVTVGNNVSLFIEIDFPFEKGILRSISYKYEYTIEITGIRFIYCFFSGLSVFKDNLADSTIALYFSICVW